VEGHVEGRILEVIDFASGQAYNPGVAGLPPVLSAGR
jgi:hypothetical protein